MLLLVTQIMNPNLKIVDFINRENARYSPQLRKQVYMLNNYTEPYELFLKQETLRNVREQFLTKIKFVSIN